MNEAIEDCVGVGWIADHRVPVLDGELAGDDGGAAAVAFLENLQEVVSGLGVERLESPIVEDEELDAAERADDPRIATVGFVRLSSLPGLGLGTKLNDEQDLLSRLPLPARDHPARHLVVLSVHAELA